MIGYHDPAGLGLLERMARRVLDALEEPDRPAEAEQPERMVPTQRQRDFLGLDCEEALFGGAVGGAKTEALLMWLAEGIHIANYSGIFFRRTYPQLAKSNDSAIAKSHRMYRPLGGKFNSTEKQWRFPSGAMIELGHLPYEDSVYDYQGPSYHRVAFDELTQFTEGQYDYLGTRIRKSPGYPISMGRRAASNPGGTGHLWVKNRFISQEALTKLRGLTARDPSQPGLVFWSKPGVAFVPARLADNPYIDFDDYAKRLSKMAPVLRERLLNGDWGIIDGGLISSDWFRYYRTQGDHIVLQQANGAVFKTFDRRKGTLFIVGDTAGTSQDKAKEARGKPPSWSVMGVWLKPPSSVGRFLVLIDVWRERVGFADLCQAARRLHDQYKCRMAFEDKHFGPALQDLLAREGLPASLVVARVTNQGNERAKVERSSAFQTMLSRGEVFLPEDNNGWRPVYESELISWTGHPDEPDDQIDMSSYAAILEPDIGGVWGRPQKSVADDPVAAPKRGADKSRLRW